VLGDGQMRRLTLDEVRSALPDLEELRPIFDDLMSRSEPDPARTWAGSGALGTVGSRLVPGGSFAERAADLARLEADRLTSTYALVGAALSALAEGDPGAAAETFLEIAAREEDDERPDRALAYAEAAYRAVEGTPERRTAALAVRRSARALRALGRFPEALHRYQRSHDLALDVSDTRGAAEAAIGAGNVLEDQGRWDEAEEWYRTALRTLEGVDGPTPERWHALLTLHIVARTRGAIEESLPLLEEAEEAAESVDPGSSVQFIENARGQLLMARGDYRAAEWAFRTALDAARHARARVVIRLNLAEACLAQERTLDAAEEAREAEREAVRERIVTKLPEVYRLLGRIAAAEKNPDAFVLFERALDIAEERNLPALERALTLQAYSEAEASRGDADAALHLRSRARELFAAAGVRRERQRWADVFDTAGAEDSPIAGPET